LNRHQVHIAMPIVLTLFFTAIGWVGTLVVAITAMSTIGPRPALLLYGKAWLRAIWLSVEWSAGAVAGLLVLLGILVGVNTLYERLRKRFSLLRNVDAQSLITIGGCVFVLAYIVIVTRSNARDEYRKVVPLASGRLAASKMLQNQQTALAGLSHSAQELIGRLDATERQIQDAKSQLTRTLQSVAQQQRAVDESITSLEEISIRQAALRQQLSSLQQALGGGRPITVADLERSQRAAWIQGLIVGIIGSVIATYLVRGFGSWPGLWRRLRSK